MAGLLGGLFGGGNSVDWTNPDVTLAAGLLSGRGNLGANLATGLLGASQEAQAQKQFALTQQAAERANRANDLQQVNGLYQTLQMQDAMQAIQDRKNGVMHVPNPALGQLQQKMMELSGLPPMAGAGLLSTPPQAPGSMPAMPSPSAQGPQPLPAAIASQYSPVVRPQFQAQGPIPQPSDSGSRPLTYNTPNGMMPAPQPTGQPQSDPFADQRDEGDIYALMARKPELMAENRYKLSLPQVSRGVSFNPGTGRPIYGMVDNVPVDFSSGSPVVVPNQIGQAIAQRAGQTAAATQAEQFREVPIGGGQTQLMRTGDYYAQQQRRGLPPLPGAPGPSPFPPTAPSGQPALTIPPDVQAQRDAQRAQMIRAELGRETDPTMRGAMNAELGAMPGASNTFIASNFGQGGLGITPNPATQAANIEEGKARGAALGEYGKTVQDQAEAAPEIKARIGEIRQLAATVGPGVFAPYKMVMGSYLRGLGVPEKTVADSLGNVGDMQALVKQSMTMAFAQTRTLGSREAAQVIDMSLKANPGLTMTPEGINRIADFMDGFENWKLARNDAKLQWQNSPNNPNKSLEGFQQYWDRTNPVTKFIPTVQQMSAPLRGASPNVVRTPDGKTYNFPNAAAAQAFRQHIGAQ